MGAAYSFLRDEMILHPSYPPSIQLPHAIWAASEFRQSFSAVDWHATTIFHKLLAGFFCHGYGGSTLRDIILSVPPSVSSHVDVPFWWLVGACLAYFSPGDVVYRAISCRGHPARLACLAGEAVDLGTTVCGAFEKGRRLQPSAPAAPFVSALASALGGSMFRYFEQRGRGLEATAEWSSPTGSIQRACFFILAYAMLRRRFGVRRARLWVTLCYVFGAVIGETADIATPSIWITDLVRAKLETARVSLGLGPQPPKAKSGAHALRSPAEPRRFERRIITPGKMAQLSARKLHESL